MKRIVFLTCTIFAVAAPLGWAAMPGRVLVGPNILVSSESSMTHFELAVAANPRNPKDIVGTGMTLTGRNHGINTRVYTSLDGGNTWADSQFDAMYAAGDSWDPNVIFTPSGTAILTALTPDPRIPETAKHGDRSAIWVYRSTDGGLSWTNSARLHPWEDHEQLAVDTSNGRYRGAIYINGMLQDKKSGLFKIGVLHSNDDGRTFQGPVIAYTMKGGANTSNPVVLPDGTLLATFYDYGSRKGKGRSHPRFGFSASRDGGRSFNAPHFVADQYSEASGSSYWSHYFSGAVDQTTSPAFAVDESTGPYRGRIYAAWGDYRYGNERVLYSYSSDRGAHWSKPAPVDPQTPSAALQYQAEVAVNNSGDVGVSWSDSRGFPANTIAYNEYLAVSSDGGRSFTSKRVSSAASYPINLGNIPGNTQAMVISSKRAVDPTQKGGVSLFVFSGFNMRRPGGDYMGLTAAGNTFHPFWIDNRDGSALIYSAGVETASGAAMTDSADPGSATDVTKYVTLLTDPVTFDPVHNDLIVPVRLHNTSSTMTVQGPMYVRIDRLRFDQSDIETGPRKLSAAMVKRFAMAFTNAANGKTGTGATFDYSRALGDRKALPPGGVSEALPWRIHVPSRAVTAPVIDAHVFGVLQ